jgi:hypothetical protein
MKNRDSLVGDDLLLVGWQHEDRDAIAWHADDAFVASIRLWLERDTEPGEALAHRGAHLWLVFADAAGEDKAI